MSDSTNLRRRTVSACPEPRAQANTVQLFPGIYYITEPVPFNGSKLQTVFFRYYRYGTVLQASITTENGRPVFIKPWRDQPRMLNFQVEYLDSAAAVRCRSAAAGFYYRGSEMVLTNPPEPYAGQTLAQFPELLDWLDSLGYITDKIR